jgi:hypothetical protein
MQPILKARLIQIRKLCRQFHVRRLDIFGSGSARRFRSSAERYGFSRRVREERAHKGSRQFLHPDPDFSAPTSIFLLLPP